MDIKKTFLLFIILFAAFTIPCYAYDIEYGCSVRVGIIDSGVNADKVAITQGYNFLENNTDITDNKGHGTKIAQTISDIVPKAELIALKCTEYNQNNDNNAIIKAIYKAVDDYKCDVLNISIGMPDTEELKKAVDYAAGRGCIIVSAVGNDGEISYKKGKVYYPAGYENVIGVGATDENNVVCEYSQKNISVFITTKSVNGTSFAAAKITGAAAVAKQFDKRLTAPLFMQFLRKTAIDYGDVGYDTSYGYGVFDFDLFQKALVSNYSLLVTEKKDGIVTVSNLSDNDVTAKVLCTGDTIDCKEILFKSKEKTQLDIKNISKCFIWQKSIYNIIWIERGE
ncbi:MAG: S8 family peptidase [Monoglobaceae bacterium]